MPELKTVWGENLNPDSILPEYPRPQLVRDSYVNLNGHWMMSPVGFFECHAHGRC